MILPVAAFFVTAAEAVATWAGASALNGFLANTALALASNVIRAKLAGRRRPERPQVGFTGRVQQGGVVPRSFILGRYATAGSLVYHNSWGEAAGVPNAYYTRVIALSDLPVTGLAGIWLNGERVTLGAPEDAKGFPIVELTNTFNVDEIGTTTISQPVGGNATVPDFSTIARATTFGWVRFYDGTQVGADALLTDDVSSAERPWNSNAVGTGVAYAVVTLRYNPNWMPNPLAAEWLFELDGIAVDNPAGGSIAADANPIRQVYHIVKGMTYGGEPFYGPQTDQSARLNIAELTAEAAKCDAAVPGTAGLSDAQKLERFGSLTVPARYRAGAEVRVDVAPADLIPDLLAACNGKSAVTAFGYRFVTGEPRGTVLAIDDDDIRTTAPQSFSPILSLADSVNAVTAEYPEPDEGWQVTDAPPIYDAAREAEDGGRRLPTRIDLPTVPFREQVQRLMAAALAEARRARRNSLVLSRALWGLEPLDEIEMSSSRHGYAAKVMLADGVFDQGDGDTRLDLSEIDPADYDWDAAADYTAPTRGAVVTQPVTPIGVPGWAVTGVVLPDGSGQGRRAAILASWTGDMEDARAITVQVRLAGTTRPAATMTFTDIDTGGGIVAEGIQPSTSYEVRGKVTPFSRRQTIWTAWTSVTTPAVPLAIENDIEALFAEQGLFAIRDVATISGLPAGDRLGDKVFARDTGKLYEWNGAAWVLVISTADVDDLLGQMDAAKVDQVLAARTILAEKQVLTGINQVQNPGFEDGATGWSGISGEVSINVGNGRTGDRALAFNITSGADAAVVNGNVFPVEEGQYFRVWCWASTASTPTATELRFGLRFFAADGTPTGTREVVISPGALTLAYQKFASTVLVPAGSASAQPQVRAIGMTAGNMRVDDCFAAEAHGAELIVDGTIKGDKIEANTITGGLMAASGIITNTAQINDALISTAKIIDLNVTRAKVAGNAVTTTRTYSPVSVTGSGLGTGVGFVVYTFPSWTSLDIGTHFVQVVLTCKLSVLDSGTSSLIMGLEIRENGGTWTRKTQGPLLTEDNEGGQFTLSFVDSIPPNATVDIRLVLVSYSSVEEFTISNMYMLAYEETGK